MQTKEGLKKAKLTRQQTRDRRKSQFCRVYQVKIDKSSLSKSKLDYLSRLFLEAKWWYNYVLGQHNIFETDCKVKKIKVMNKDKQFEEKDLIYLTSTTKKDLKLRIITSIKSLYTRKKKHKKVGKLKFKSFLRCIPGRFYIKNLYVMKIECCKELFRVNGLKQILKDSEISNISLTRRHGDFYFNITTWQMRKQSELTGNSIGIDFGIKDTLSFSNGVKVNVDIKESKRIKKLQQKSSRQEKKSKNRFKTKILLEKAYDERNNKKKNVCNKIVGYLNSNFDHICVQNDCISGWQKLYGRKINSSIVGRTLSKLKQLPKTIIVDRFFPSTKLCPICYSKNLMLLSERTYKCNNCFFEEDRDVKSAKIIEIEALKNKIPISYGDFKLVENKTSTQMYDYFNQQLSKYCSVKQEERKIEVQTADL
jgi:putative transposase